MVSQLKIRFSVVLLIFLFFVSSQKTATAQCNTNVSICTPGVAGPFNFSNPGTPVSTCLDFFGPNVGYIILYITQSGNLNMQIDGSSTFGFLDVAVFNIPPNTSPCTAIASTANQIGCNYASSSSGCNQFGNSFGCLSSVPAPAVVAGQVLMIVVENWSGSSSNFTLQLGTTPGSAQTGPPNPAINPAGPFCSTSPSTQLTAVNNGGTWSGPGTSATGMFNPATAGLGTHTINYSIGSAPCNSASTTTIQVVNTPSITVNTATICPGGSATLTATPNAPGGNYIWQPGNLTGQSITVSPGTTTTYTCTYSFGGCTSTPRTTTVTVSGAAALSVNSATICPGGSTTLTASGGSSYTWAPAAGLSATTGASVTANPTTTTIYTVTNGGCPGSATSTVSISPPLNITVNSPTTCVGTGVAINASGATTYSWTPGTGLSATTGASVTANPTTTTTYTVTGTTAGCNGTNTSTVTVNPLPVVTVNSPTVCSGASATLTASGATTYSWTPGTGLSATTGASVTANPTTTTTYTVIGTTAGCNGTNTSTVTVNPLPVIVVNSPTVCSGAATTLTASGATTYSWTPGTGLSATTGASVTANPTTTTTYTITGTTAGCNGTNTSTVTVNPLPVIIVNSPTVCTGASTTLTASGATSYSWTPGTGLSATTGASVTANPTTTTTYTITGTTAGCNGTNTSTVTVNPLPVIVVNSPTVCSGAAATITASGATTYSWTPGTGLSATTGASVTANPTATTTYTITGTTAGCNGTSTSTVNIGALPVVTVNSPTVCSGAAATLTASGATTYSWTPGTGLSATTGASVTANPTITTTYTVTGTTAGCNGTNTSTVTINPLPVVTVNSPTVCSGASATLTASGATTYSWTPGTGLSATTGASVTANPTATTTYTVTGTTAGCNGTNTSTVTILPLPVLTVNSPTICAGSGVAVNVTGATTYSWTPGTGLSATTGASVTANPAATTTYTITGTTSGCNSVITSTVTVNPLPVVAVNSATVCAGVSSTLTASGATSYSWDPPAGLSSTSGVSVTANPSTTTVYTVTGTTNGCNSVQTSTVTINGIPTITPISVSICLGDSTTLTASGAATYVWSPPTGLSATTGNSVTATPTTTIIYTVTGTTNGCDGTATSTVTVNAIPVVTVNSPSFCAGSNATLSASGGSSFSWSPATGLSSTTGTSVIANPVATTVYTVTETSSGCNGTNTSTVTVNPLPVVNAGNTGPYCVNQTIQLNCPTTAVSYNWSGPGSFTSFSQNPALTTAAIVNSGVYSVTVTDVNSCQGTITTSVVVNALPVVSVSNNSPVCENTTLNLTASGGTSYSWSGPNAFNSAQQNPAIVSATLAMSGTYTVVVTDANNCVNSNLTTVSVVAKPGAPGVSNSTYCFGETALPLSAQAFAGGTLNWYGVSPTGSYSAVPTVPGTSVAGTSTYYVSQTVSGCEGNQAAISVLVRPLPTGLLSAIAPKCVPLCDDFVFSSPSILTSYSWNMGNGIVNSTNDTITHCYSESGNYDISVTITDNAGCSNVIPFSNWVQVNEIPSAEFTYSPNPVSILEPNITFYSYSTGSSISSTDWNFYLNSDVLYSTSDVEPTFIFPDIDTFLVELTVTSVNGCTNSTIKPIIVQDDYAVYIPNAFTPDNDNINEEFRVFGIGISKVNMLIFDRWGGIIYTSDEIEKGWDGRDKRNNRVEKGVYIYKIEVVNNKGVKSLRTGHVTLVR